MLTDTLQDAFNEQMKNEFYSAYLYMAMSGYFHSEDLPGFASWMRVQALEEMIHGEKIFNFLCETGSRTQLLALDGPENDFYTPLEALEHALRHEKFVTSRINRLVDMATDERNHAAHIFLQWFVTEQIEEESSFSAIIKKLQRVEGDGHGLLIIDQELGLRQFNPIEAAAGGAS